MLESENTMLRELTHFIGGKAVHSKSVRFADVFDPKTGTDQAKAPLTSEAMS